MKEKKPRDPYRRLNKTANFEKVTKQMSERAAASTLPRIWHALSDESRAQWVKPLMEVGHSNITAAKTLGIGSSNKIAGVRERNNIPSRNPLPPGGRKKKLTNIVPFSR